MQDFFTGASLLTMGMLLIVILVFGAITSQLVELRDEAEKERDALQERVAQLTSSGADFAKRIGWRKRKLMNRPEYALYQDLHRVVMESGRGHRLFSQVSYGAFLEATARSDLEKTRKAAFHAVARKWADFLIIDQFGQPIAVIEYQGSGHYQGNAHDRDHAKRIACHAAGLRFVEVAADGLTDGQRRDLASLLYGPSARVA